MAGVARNVTVQAVLSGVRNQCAVGCCLTSLLQAVLESESGDQPCSMLSSARGIHAGNGVAPLKSGYRNLPKRRLRGVSTLETAWPH